MPEEEIEKTDWTKLYDKHDDLEFEKRLEKYGVVSPPVGTILPYFGGYYNDKDNADYKVGIADENTIAKVNKEINPLGWWVCDGSELYDEESPIFNVSGRFLPNLTDGRFLMGSTAIGGVGGENSIRHNHNATESASSSTSGAGTSHLHGDGTLAGSQDTHQHTLSGSTGNQDASHAHSMQNHDHDISNVSHTHDQVTAGGASTGAADGATSPTGPTNTANTGNQSASHAHPVGTLATAADGDDAVSISGNTGSEAAHTHSYNETDSVSINNETLENRPQYLACLFIIRVK